MAKHQLTRLYGIKNCDTVKKARAWLAAQSIGCAFHDLRDDGLSAAAVNRWLQAVGMERLVNKRSTTWKQLPEAVRQDLRENNAGELLQQYPTLVKRPVLEYQGQVFVGFKDSDYQQIFTHSQ